MNPIKRFLIVGGIISLLLILVSGCDTESSQPEAGRASTESVGDALSTVAPTSIPQAEPSLEGEDASTSADSTPSPQPQSVSEESTTEHSSNNVLTTVTPRPNQKSRDNVVGTYINTSVDDYYMVVSYAIEEDASDLAQEMKRIIVTASLGNESAEAIVVGENALTLIDEAGNRYSPNIYATAEMSPALIGVELDPNEDIYGFVTFDVPAETNGAYLEWCLSGASSCEQTLHAPIP